MKGKYAPGLPGPKGCDTVCNARLCPKHALEKSYSYLPSAKRMRSPAPQSNGDAHAPSLGVLMPYQRGFFAGWDTSAYFLVLLQLAAFWFSAAMVKHLSAVYKNVGQGASTLATYYIGDLLLSYDPQNEKTNTTRLPCVLASIIIMLSIVLFATSGEEKKGKSDQGSGDVNSAKNGKADGSGNDAEDNRAFIRNPTITSAAAIELAAMPSRSASVKA